MYRKQINSYPKNILPECQMSFFFWQCITLNLPNQDVYLVIKNEERMKDFIKFLIYELKTVDGKKGSGIKIHEALLK